MRLVRHRELADAGPTACAGIDVAAVSGSRARVVVYPLPPDKAAQADEQPGPRQISLDTGLESLG